MTIRAKVIYFDSELIYDMYGLLNADKRLFREKNYAPKSLLAAQLCIEREVP